MQVYKKHIIYIDLKPQGQPFINRCLAKQPTISYVKIGNHHPIDSQPFINGGPWGSRDAADSHRLS